MAAANPNTGTSGAMVFRAGQVIYIEEPYAAVLSSDRSLSTCSCCFRTIKAGETLTPCLRCNRLIYCSDQCFAQDGSYHAVECEVLQLVENFPTEQYRLAVRVISRYLIEKAKDEDTAKYFFSHRRTIDCIPSHINEVNEKEIEYMKQKAQTLKHKLDRAYQAEVSVDELMELLFKIRSSYHVILESSSVRHVKIGLGLYLGATKIRNTCEALQNYVRIFNGPNFVLKAVREFTVQDPLDIRINYVSPNHPLRKRRHDINFRFNFLCECPRCVFEENQQEQNLPTNMETFVESPLVDGWERMAKRFFITVRSFPPGNYHIYLLAYKLQLLAHCRKKHTAAVIYGIRALGDCLDFEDRKQILYMLCHDMAGLGLNDPGHRKHQEFETLRRDAIDLFTLVFDRNCCLVRHLTSLAHRAPRREPTIEEEDQCDEEEEGEEEEDDDEEEEDEGGD